MLELPSAANRPDRNRLPNRGMAQGGDWHDHWLVGRLVFFLPDRPTPHSDSGKPPWMRRLTFSVRRSAFGVRRSAFNVQRSAFSVQRSAFSVQRSAFSVQRSTFNVQRSAFNVRRSAFGVQRRSQDMGTILGPLE